MRRTFQKIQMAFLNNIFIKCPDCKVTFRMDKEGLKQTKKFNGPYCPKCAKRLKDKVFIND